MTRAAIVGAGFVARVHARALRELGVEVAAVCGRTLAGAEALVGELREGSAYDDLAALLRTERVDALHVCTPNAFHSEQALAALGRGIPVICEKPLAVSSQESARMLEAAQSRGLVGATCYHVRGYPLVEEMRAGIAAGTLGELRCVHGRYACDDALGAGGGWRLDPVRSGPSYVVGDLGTHWLDAAEHVTGLRVEEVLADFRSFGGGPLEDHAQLSLRFRGGAVGAALFSALTAGRKNQLLLECEGARAGFTWDQESPNELLLRPAEGPIRVVVKDPATNAPSARPLARYPAGHAEGYGGAFATILRGAYKGIAGEADALYPTFADGHHGMRVLEAAVASARTGDWVAV